MMTIHKFHSVVQRLFDLVVSARLVATPGMALSAPCARSAFLVGSRVPAAAMPCNDLVLTGSFYALD